MQSLIHVPVAKVTNLSRTIEELKEKGLWFVCADMDGESMSCGLENTQDLIDDVSRALEKI